MGMGTVFCVLILISLVIYCFRFISAAQNRSKANAPEAPKQSAAPAAAPAVQPKLTDDSELVAAIMAAIAASTGQSEDSFIVRSIVRR
jgi:sodium pump decarboxylase gamma subunit